MNEVTIYSIAKMTGVSAATVSRVLNNNPHISKATKLKVLKALEENGYVPNDLARNLSSKSSMMIGILVSDIRENKQSNTLHTLCQEFDQQGYSCLIYNTGFDPINFAGFAKQLSQKKVDGAILMGTVFKCPE
ncbi:MAG: LacI family DNA-binding transcriptional regulator, partial [Sphaerochaetaceae bacterium]|nr:LacI family DNA-binding transcriptional regulator [Sphaerochaetaceae bacterium]